MNVKEWYKNKGLERKIPIPKGFEAFGESDSLRILDEKNGNMFTCIPVNANEFIYNDQMWYKIALQEMKQQALSQEVKAYCDTALEYLDLCEKSVKEYQCIFASTYAASKGENGIPMSLPEQMPWTEISWGPSEYGTCSLNAVEVSKAMYPLEDNRTGIFSYLPGKAEIKALLQYLFGEDEVIVKGNFSHQVRPTGGFVQKGIADFFGNTDEWMDAFSLPDKANIVGGNYTETAEMVRKQFWNKKSIAYAPHPFIGFRVFACIKPE